MALPNFLEYESIDSANQVDLEKYTFIRFSDTRNKFIFKIRERGTK